MSGPEASRTPYIIRGGIAGRERLRVLASIHRSTTLNLLQRAGVCPGMVGLDIGCGGGDVSLELARMVMPEGRVVGIDVDAVKLEIASAEARDQQVSNVEYRVADLGEVVLPQEFDFAHARFVLTHLPDPKTVLAKVRAALKPGGIIIIADTNFGALFARPECPAASRFIEIYSETLRRRHGDANIGLRLPELLDDAGFEDIHVSVVQHAGMSGEKKLIIPMTMEAITDAVIAEGVASRDESESLVAELYDFARDPHTLLSGPRVIETWAHRPLT